MSGVKIDWIGGNCPVHAEGLIDGKQFSFRARGNRWSIEICDQPRPAPRWRYEEPYGLEPYEAGHMNGVEAHALILRAAEIYRGEKAAA
jgi:hypothetical protein